MTSALAALVCLAVTARVESRRVRQTCLGSTSAVFFVTLSSSLILRAFIFLAESQYLRFIAQVVVRIR